MRPDPHELDQEQAFLRGMARVVAHYVDELEGAGLSRPEALMFAAHWHQHFLAVTRASRAFGGEAED